MKLKNRSDFLKTRNFKNITDLLLNIIPQLRAWVCTIRTFCRQNILTADLVKAYKVIK